MELLFIDLGGRFASLYRIMPANDLYERDSAAIGSLQKLRFFPSALTGGKGVRVTDQSGRSLLDLSAAWGAPASAMLIRPSSRR